MKFGWVRYSLVTFLFCAQGLLFFLIPSLLPRVYLSPDETAVAVTARQFGVTGSFRLWDMAVMGAEWAHPRSFVSNGKDLVPVGFLGMPLIAGSAWKLFGEYGMLFLTPLLVLSCLYPLWRFMKGLGFAAQVATGAVWLSYPLVILYANRGLFPNLAVVCLVLWSSFLLWRKRGWVTLASAGILFGTALSIRPTEFVWAAIWITASWLDGKTQKTRNQGVREMALFIGFALIMPITAAIFAWKTYGSPLLIGYWLRDPVPGAAQAISAAETITHPERIWPFGFHPRAVWSNAENYLVYILGPWFSAGILACAVWSRKKSARPVLAVALWTTAVLCFIYGNTVYQDHVGHNVVSVGNSYLRYLLPLAPLFAVAVGSLASWLLEALPRRRAKMAVSAMVGCLVLAGIWTSFTKDDEGLNAVIPEIVRYSTIRQMLIDSYGQQAIVVSDRSDKIFFPATLAVSPMPDDAHLADLISKSSIPVLYFDTTLNNDRISDILKRGFFVEPLFTSKNQTLYEMSAIIFKQNPNLNTALEP